MKPGNSKIETINDLYNIPISYEPNEQMDRKYCGKNIDTQKRFELLVKRIADYLATKEN